MSFTFSLDFAAFNQKRRAAMNSKSNRIYAVWLLTQTSVIELQRAPWRASNRINLVHGVCITLFLLYSHSSNRVIDCRSDSLLLLYQHTRHTLQNWSCAFVCGRTLQLTESRSKLRILQKLIRFKSLRRIIILNHCVKLFSRYENFTNRGVNNELIKKFKFRRENELFYSI